MVDVARQHHRFGLTGISSHRSVPEHGDALDGEFGDQ